MVFAIGLNLSNVVYCLLFVNYFWQEINAKFSQHVTVQAPLHGLIIIVWRGTHRNIVNLFIDFVVERKRCFEFYAIPSSMYFSFYLSY